ncbi:MAG: peptidase [Eubacteriales Family XIII. Incertae Sedis bacterium]|nr:MAG: peptidase [Clostridiales Family XIII bacterium]
MPYYYYFDPTYIVLIPAVIFAFYAQMKVNSAYSRYSRVRNRRGITGAQAARMILDANGLSDVRIEITKGRLSDHYDPKKRVMRLSPEVYGNPSIASVSIAAHESGHAVQHGESYMPLKIRNAIVPVVNIASYMAWPLLIIGLLMGQGTGTLIFDIGVLFFLGVIVFHAITLPVELNASKRAIAQLSSLGIVYPEETAGSKKVLSAAALTYVAALATAILNLVRILMLRRDE